MKSLLLLLISVCLSSAFVDTTPPKYVVNLDLPPTERWAHVVKNYIDLYPIMEKEFYKILPKAVVEFAEKIVGILDEFLPVPYADEVRGIAKYTNSTVGETLVGNLAYDFTAFHHKDKSDSEACTSIVAVASNGMLFHGRNLDYSFHDLLRNFTVVIDFQKGGHTIFTGTTFAGYIGVLTGMRQNGISISLNERNTGDWWENILAAMATRLHGLAGILIRDTLTDQSMDYSKALETLSTKSMIAPCYIILGGSIPSEAAVITRNRLSAVDIWHINNTDTWYILETNYDHWNSPPKSDNRRDPAIEAMNKIGKDHINMHTLYQVLSTPPILNNNTAYTTIMSTHHGLYYTMIRHP